MQKKNTHDAKYVDYRGDQLAFSSLNYHIVHYGTSSNGVTLANIFVKSNGIS